MRFALGVVLLLVTHLFVVAVGFQLGRSVVERSQEKSRMGSGARLSLTRSASHAVSRSQMESVVARAAEANRESIAESYSARLQQALADTATMDAKEVLQALRELRHHPAGSEKLLGEQALLARYAEVDPETALTYVDRLGGLDHSLGKRTVMSSWAASDPESASAYYDEQADDFGVFDDDQRATAAAIAAEWAEQDLDSAMGWVETLSPEVQGEAYQRIMAQAVLADPQRAIELIGTMPDGIDRREMLGTLANQWTHQAPAEAGAWLATLNESDQLTAMPAIVESWMQTDPMSASKWLAQAPDSAAKDLSIAAMTQSVALRRDPEAAVAWSTMIQDPATRAETLQQAALRWARLDPEAAQAWFGDGESQP